MALFSRTRSIQPQEAARLLAAGELTLVDVREPEEVRAEAVDGALHIPFGALSGRLGELGGRGTVAFLCQSGVRSAAAARAAGKAGVDAVNVRGGIVAWARAGLPLTRQGATT
jgi:rhodanese-related sulfurtransferase